MTVQTCRVLGLCTGGLLTASGLVACSQDRPPPPARSADARAPRQAEVDAPKELENSTPYRARIGRGTELYLPPWFAPKRGGYDLIVHFHGLGKIQEANVERAQLNVAVVSVNLGVGTEAYAGMFRDPTAFDRLLADTDAEIARSGRAPGARLRRVALSAWSAGFVCVAKLLAQPAHAVLLADGFFSSFTDLKKRTINEAPLEKFTTLIAAATRGDKLFAITHTAIPTSKYPSVEETVGKLLDMASIEKVPSDVGPQEMHEQYAVDRGSFHVRGYDGTTARAHIRQIRRMGETLYPYLKERWAKEDDGASPARVASPSPAP